jgi:hypothetical protein
MIRFSRFRRGDPPDSTAPETEGLLITSGFPLCEAIMADAFPKIPIFIGARAEDQWEGLSDIDPTLLLLNFFLDMEGDDFTKKEIMAPQGKYFFNLTFHLNRTFIDERRFHLFGGDLLPSHGRKLICLLPGKYATGIHLSEHLFRRKIDDKLFGSLHTGMGVSFWPDGNTDHGRL